MGKAIDYERMPMVASKGINSVPKVPDYMLREQAWRREQEEEEPVEAIEEEDRSLEEVVTAMKNLMIRRQAKAITTEKENLLAWLHENAISIEMTQQNAWRSIFFTSNTSDVVSEHDLQSLLDTYKTQKTQ
jgi:phage antirepressor YoqD-like protein